MDQIIVKWRDQHTPAAASAKLDALAKSSGLRVERKGLLRTDIEVLKFERELTAAELEQTLRTWNARADVEYAAPDHRRYAHAIPSDPLFIDQWYLRADQPAATRAEQAWDLTTGSTGVIVAVLDTGVRFEHPDLRRLEAAGKLLPGFDFIANSTVANDGGGRDADASDPGDWVTAQEASQPPFNNGNCIPEGGDHADSSWHGTRVSSLVGALTNNAGGMAGMGWNTAVLPVRVLGKCGGIDSDIIAGMRWAAGLEVPGAPLNPSPAHIINLSLGSDGACTAAYRNAIAEISARGVLIVASAGNDGGPVGSPANCDGVLGVAAIRHAGTKVGFSNLGPEVDLAAPGGNCANENGGPCRFPILVATNTGTTTPALSSYTDSININVGTSFSAPLAAAAAALMRAANPQLTPSRLISLLQQTAAVFPTNSGAPICRTPTGPDDLQLAECVCTTQTCGAGMLNAYEAVRAAIAEPGAPPTAVIRASSAIATGVAVTIDGSGSFAASQRSIASWAWSVHDVVGVPPTVANAASAITTLHVSGPSQFNLRLTVTDDAGVQHSAQLAVVASDPTPVTPAAPPPSSSGGGGGGGDVWLVLLLALGAGLRLLRVDELRGERA